MKIFWRAINGLIDDDAFTQAAAISYYGIFSLFPMLIFILALISGAFHGTQVEQKVIEAVITWIPSAVGSTVVDAIRQLGQAHQKTLTIIGGLGMAWSGSSVFGTLRNSIYAAYGIKTTTSWFLRKLADLALVAGVGIFFLMSILGTASISVIQKLTDDFTALNHYPWLVDLLGESGLVWKAALYTLPFVISVIAFFSAYWIIPLFRIPARRVFPAALLAAILFELAKLGFAFYVLNFSRFNVIFGSLAAVIAFLFWTYVGAIILLFGAEIAAEIHAASKTR